MKEYDVWLKSLVISCLCIILCIVPAAAGDVAVERSLSSSSIEQYQVLNVTLSIDGLQAGGIVETIPTGCTFSATDYPTDKYRLSGNKILFSAIEEPAITYRVKAMKSGSWTFSGVWADAVNMTNGTIPNSTIQIYSYSGGDSDDSGSAVGVTTNTTSVPDTTAEKTHDVMFEGKSVYEVVVSGTGLPEDLNVSCASIDLPGALPAAPGEVYQYYNISCPATNGSVESAVIRFSVPKDWMENRSLGAGGISLYHYVDGWSSLPTTLTGTENGTYTFEAQSPGFSIFAIAATKPNTSASVQTTQPVTIATPKGQDTSVAGATADSSTTTGIPFLPLVGGLVVLVIVVGAGIWWYRGRNDQKEE